MPRAFAWTWLAAVAALALAHQGQEMENATLAEEVGGGRVKRAGAPEVGLADDGRSSRQEPLYVEEPAWVLLDRRETAGPVRQASAARAVGGSGAVPVEMEDPFWVARGRRREMSSSSSSAEEPFWAARGRREMEDLFWPARGKRQQEEEMSGVAEEEEEAGLSGQWAAAAAPRDRRAVLRDYLASLSGSSGGSRRQYFVPARGKRDGVSKRAAEAARRRTMGSGSAEEPFWAARGRRGGSARGQAARLLRLRLASGSSEEPFWAARGRRAGPSSASGEGPFWAARGRSLAGQPAFWPARGRRDAAINDNADTAEAEGEDSENAEDRSFWEKLHEKDQTRTRQ